MFIFGGKGRGCPWIKAIPPTGRIECVETCRGEAGTAGTDMDGPSRITGCDAAVATGGKLTGRYGYPSDQGKKKRGVIKFLSGDAVSTHPARTKSVIILLQLGTPNKKKASLLCLTLSLPPSTHHTPIASSGECFFFPLSLPIPSLPTLSLFLIWNPSLSISA